VFGHASSVPLVACAGTLHPQAQRPAPRAGSYQWV
jgi:hypothetical protein